MEIFIAIMAIIGGILGGADATPNEAEVAYATEVVEVVEAQSTVTFNNGTITAYVG